MERRASAASPDGGVSVTLVGAALLLRDRTIRMETYQFGDLILTVAVIQDTALRIRAMTREEIECEFRTNPYAVASWYWAGKLGLIPFEHTNGAGQRIGVGDGSYGGFVPPGT